MEYHQFIVDNKLDGTIKNLKDLRSRWEEKNDEKLKELEELEDNSPNSVKKRELANEDENKFLEYTDGKMSLSFAIQDLYCILLNIFYFLVLKKDPNFPSS